VPAGATHVLRALAPAPREEQWAALAFLAGGRVQLDAHEVHAALRRAELLLAAGGDPRRPLELRGRAVGAVAADLDRPAARARLRAGLEALVADADAVPPLREALAALLADDELAWRCYAYALLAEALGGTDEAA
jgi:hypothetical protein